MNRYPVNKSGKAQILVVEDDPDQWFLTQWALRKRFPEVEPVWKASSQEALLFLAARAQTRQQLPVLILLDLYLPSREDAWALLKIIKTSQAYCTIPVIVLSASSYCADIEHAYDLRSNAYMIKPTTDEDWLAEIEQFRRYWWDAVTLLA